MIKYFDLEQATLATHDGWRDVLPGRRPMLGAQQNFARDRRLGHRPTGIDVKHLQNRKSWPVLTLGCTWRTTPGPTGFCPASMAATTMAPTKMAAATAPIAQPRALRCSRVTMLMLPH